MAGAVSGRVIASSAAAEVRVVNSWSDRFWEPQGRATGGSSCRRGRLRRAQSFRRGGHLGRCAIGSSSAGRSRPPGRRRCCIPGDRRHSVAQERATLDSRRAAICLVAWHPCDEQVGESHQDVLMQKLACHDERKAFPVGFVDDDEEPEFAAAVGPSLDEIIGPDARRDGLRSVRRRPCNRRRRGRQGPCRLSGLRPTGTGMRRHPAYDVVHQHHRRDGLEEQWRRHRRRGQRSFPPPRLPERRRRASQHCQGRRTRHARDRGRRRSDSGYRIVTGGQTGIVGGTSAVAPL